MALQCAQCRFPRGRPPARLPLRGDFLQSHDLQGPEPGHRVVLDPRRRMAGGPREHRTMARAVEFRSERRRNDLFGGADGATQAKPPGRGQGRLSRYRTKGIPADSIAPITEPLIAGRYDVGNWRLSGLVMLRLSSSAFDPDVWSGRAVQEDFVDLG